MGAEIPGDAAPSRHSSLHAASARTGRSATIMNQEIIRTVKMILAARKSNQSKLSMESGVGRGHLSEMLQGRIGMATEAWRMVFDALGVKLVIVPKDFPSDLEWANHLRRGK